MPDIQVEVHVPDKKPQRVEVPTDMKARDFLLEVQDMLGIAGSAWSLYDKDVQQDLDPERTLGDSGVAHGHHLYLRRVEPPPPPGTPIAEPTPPVIRRPSPTWAWIVPLAVLALLLSGAGGYYLGQRANSGSASDLRRQVENASSVNSELRAQLEQSERTAGALRSDLEAQGKEVEGLRRELDLLRQRTPDARKASPLPREPKAGGGSVPKAAPSPKTEAQEVRPAAPPAGGQVREATLIKKVPPVYPERAKQRGIQGVVRLTAIINRDGKLQNIQVVSGDPGLTPAAVDAVKQWLYQPTLLNGKPVEAHTSIDVAFSLKE